MRQVKVYPEIRLLNTPFVIARGVSTEISVVVVELEQDGVKGAGECRPYSRYGETSESVLAQIAAIVPQLTSGLSRQQLQNCLPAGAARNAVDCALWNLESQLRNSTIWSEIGVIPPDIITTAQTISINEPDNMALCAKSLWERGARLLKIKLDQHLITERVVAIRSAVPEATLIVDANESWQADGLAERCQILADLGVAMLEQPLFEGDDEILSHFVHPLPVCADESCHTRGSLDNLQGRYEMVNIKLDKCGGLTEALALASEAKSRGFTIMLGCMLCTSRAILAALPLAPLARFVDLDGPSWLAEDVGSSLNFTCGKIDLRSLKTEQANHCSKVFF